MKRGEIWTAAGGVYAAKPRPCLIVQDDLYLAQPGLNSVTLIPITGSGDEDLGAVRLRVEPDARNGLSTTSDLMVDKITSTRRANVQRRVGELDARQMAQVNVLVATFLGLARPARGGMPGAGRVRRSRPAGRGAAGQG